MKIVFFVLACVACSSTPASSDGGTNDAASDEDAATLNGCASSAFVDGASVSFGGVNGSPLFAYAPPCIHVAPGTSVTFSGDFSVHPIAPGSTPTDMTTGSSNNPVPQTSTGTSLTVAFPTAGTYPYFCEMHYAAGMQGVVLVE